MNKIKLTNGVSYGAKITVADNTPFDVQFVGASEDPVNYPMAVICSGATFTEDAGVYTFTPTEAEGGEINIIAQRSSLAEVEPNA